MDNTLVERMKLLCCEQSLRDRVQHLVGNSLHSDFTFILEDENVEIPAHKVIIGTASPVLNSIVYGGDQTSSTDSTKVDGTTKESFMEILRFIYTDKININDDNVFNILNKANCYGLAGIEEKCFSYLKEQLNVSSVPWIFHQFLNSFSSSKLLKDCLKFIQLEPKSFFCAEEFQNISVDGFKLILQLDSINCTEIDLFEAMIKLAKTRCVMAGLEPTGTNQRKILNGAETLLRLEALSEGELDSCIALQSDFFTSIEIERIKAEIDTSIQSSVIRRKPFTYQDSVWIEFFNGDELPSSSFRSSFFNGDSLFICHFLNHRLNEKILNLSYGFIHHILEEQKLTPQPNVKLEVLCGSGYEWHKFKGEIPPGSVSLKKDNATHVLIGRGRIGNELQIGIIDGTTFVYNNFWKETQYNFEEVESFEILVANNVKSPFAGTGIPNDAICVGVNEDGIKIYLGKAWYRNDLLPAKVVLGQSFVSYDKEEVAVSEFEYVRLDPGTYRWEQGSNGDVPENAFDGSYTKNGETLYFGRVLHEGIYIPGKVHPLHQVFYAPYRGQEISARSYEVLVKVI